jgi:glycosyltransferase involved in cell wall biosynthesis
MSTLSVVIPAYNAEKTIIQTIESVQKQTFQDFELIVIDDGSKDNTVEVVQSFRDARIKVFSYENGGVAVARNRGISHATGEFVALLDADDLWTPDKLELQLAALQDHPDAGVAYSWTSRFMDGQKETLTPSIPVFFEGNVYAELLIYNFLGNGSNPLIRKTAIESVGEFDRACVPCEDWDFYLRLAAQWSFVLVHKQQILYRQSSNSGSSNITVMEKASLITIEKAYQATPSDLQSLKKQSLAWSYNYCALLYLQYSNDISGVNKAGQRLWKTICLYPPMLLKDYTRSLIWWFLRRWIGMRTPQAVRIALRRKTLAS